MKIQGDYTFDAPRDRVWEALFDPEVLASVMPGCERLELVGEQEYEGLLKIKVGPVQGKFNGKIRLHDIDAPNSYQMEIDGRGAPGFVKADATVRLEDDGDQTVLHYDSDAKVGGRIASVGQRLLDSSARAITKQSLEGLATVLESPAAAAAADPKVAASTVGSTAPAHARPPRPQPPSQAEFARNVAKEVAKDIVPKPVLVGAVVGMLLLIVYAAIASGDGR